MISLVLGWLVKNWRLVAYAAFAVVVAAFLWRVASWHKAYKELPEVRAQLENERSCGEGSVCEQNAFEARMRAAQVSDDIRKDYEQKLADLRNHPPAPPVRLCRPARPGDVRPSAPARPADGAAPGGDVPVEVGEDIGQQLFDLADEADREALKLKSLQDWNRAMGDGK